MSRDPRDFLVWLAMGAAARVLYLLAGLGVLAALRDCWSWPW